ncbi:MAG: hypothetical protein AAF493_06495 [Pseudomonadota bacterium]
MRWQRNHLTRSWVSDKKRDISIESRRTQTRELRRIAHDPKSIEDWALAVRAQVDGPIAVVLETSYGPIVHALQKYDFLVMFPISPAMLAKYRQAFNPSGAKDDPESRSPAIRPTMRSASGDGTALPSEGSDRSR